ncbi:MAG: SHOCT domain-containing protein [Candidatus Hydrogenedentes bacterium]|nr:SHOCT domain-containing protein [Candidatus Hydrogenedentota bacterium]
MQMFELIAVLVFGTSLWVLFDSKSIGVKKGKIKGFFDMGRVGWFLSCLLLWIVAFPAYLVKRSEYKRRTAADAQPGSIQGSDVPSQIAKLAELKVQGLLTEEEFQGKKRELLTRM